MTMVGPESGRSQGQATSALGGSASRAGSLRGSAEALGLQACASGGVRGGGGAPFLCLYYCDWEEDGAGWIES